SPVSMIWYVLLLGAAMETCIIYWTINRWFCGCYFWLAGRIYRTGILLYGKKVNYKRAYNGYFIKVNEQKRIAVIDCGTNIFNLLIADRSEGGI
ncbi:MAG: hypothetical protein IPJ26_15970, partial [Bacteroidetes bacterium]|nr:hypothetical protein [Bacteroidota bacterium]